MTLTEYVKKRNGVSIGSSKSLRNNLYRSLGAKNFSTFWNYWNPIFGYYLGNFVFKPLKKILPVGMALLFTFIFCGLIHDAVTMIFRWKISLFFTIWFSMMGVAVLLTRYFNYNFNKLDFSRISQFEYNWIMFFNNSIPDEIPYCKLTSINYGPTYIDVECSSHFNQ